MVPSPPAYLSFLPHKNGAHYNSFIGSCREWLRSSLQSTQPSTGSILSAEGSSGNLSQILLLLCLEPSQVPMDPISRGVKIEEPTVAPPLPPTLSAPHPLPLFTSLPQRQLHWLPHLPSHNSGAVSPQGLCTCSPMEAHVSIPTSTA